MAFKIRRMDYFYATVTDEPGEAYELLTRLAEMGISLAAFTAVPFGPTHTQLTLFPENVDRMRDAAKNAGLAIDGPHPAILVQGDDELGALASVHARLAQAGVNVFASNGVTDGKGSYGYVLYIRPEKIDHALAALDI
ncbi:MAG: hypothetical protein GY715_01185 [Planctomycetes bacterium]|nr:hypothetical protein [Planctomycetota bacterium]